MVANRGCFEPQGGETCKYVDKKRLKRSLARLCRKRGRRTLSERERESKRNNSEVTRTHREEERMKGYTEQK